MAVCDGWHQYAQNDTTAGKQRARPVPPLSARDRWGILPGQDALVMDIGTLDVPEEDFSRLRQMQMSTMEWDEAGEAALKKGFKKGKRTKFMGERGEEGGRRQVVSVFCDFTMCCSRIIISKDAGETVVVTGAGGDCREERKVRTPGVGLVSMNKVTGKMMAKRESIELWETSGAYLGGEKSYLGFCCFSRKKAFSTAHE